MLYMNSNSPTLLLHLAPGDPEPVRDQISRQVSDRIIRGELSAGDLLPGHRHLARQHRVAPSTVEAAYEVLIADGLLIETTAGDVEVAELGPERRRDLVENLQLEKLVAQELGRRELEMARDVQRRLLPPSEVTGPGWEVAARCLPARVVAGDFYDILRHTNGTVDVVVADVAGKGFAASLIMASTKAMLPFVTEDGTVAESLTHLNRRLALELGRGEFVALTIARYDPNRGSVELANAGAPDPYLLGPDRTPRPLSVPGPRLPLGVREEVAYASRTVEISVAERLLLLTDGLPEARDETGDPMGYSALESILGEEPSNGSPSIWLAKLYDKVQRRDRACTRGRLDRGIAGTDRRRGDLMILNLSDLSDEPLHAQISRQIRAKILVGDLDGGDALPSIRGMAKGQRVSVITVQRAYDDLEREGLLRSRRGKGFWVTDIPDGRKNTMAEDRFADALKKLVGHAAAEGLSQTDMRRILEQLLKEEGNK